VGSLAWIGDPYGKIEYGSQGEAPVIHVVCGAFINCRYYLPSLELKGGSPAVLGTAETTLTKKSGSLCPSTTTLKPATYTVTTPKPLYPARAAI
jgi:hypothetical protein